MEPIPFTELSGKIDTLPVLTGNIFLVTVGGRNREAKLLVQHHPGRPFLWTRKKLLGNDLLSPDFAELREYLLLVVILWHADLHADRRMIGGAVVSLLGRLFVGVKRMTRRLLGDAVSPVRNLPPQLRLVGVGQQFLAELRAEKLGLNVELAVDALAVLCLALRNGKCGRDRR